MGWQGKPITPPSAARLDPATGLLSTPSGSDIPESPPLPTQPFRPSLARLWGSAITVGWEVYEVCPFEHQGDPERRGGVVMGMSDTHAVVIRTRRRGKLTEPREQAIPIDNLDPDRVLPPDRRTCHRTARMILAAIGAGRGELDDDDRKWITLARQLAEVR